MTSARKLWSNRRNALRSTGPRTGAGKARAARNARRHGLNLSAACDPAWADEIVALARIIAGPDACAERLELASRIAAAQIDVVRARRARCDLLPAAPCTPDGIKHLAAIVRYERRAFARRNSACRDFDAAGWRNEPNGRKPRSYRMLEYGRLIGEHLSRHIPGNPTIIMEHMPDAGGVIAGNHLYGPGPQDGTKILLSHSIPLAEKLEPEGVRFESAKFQWLTP